MNNFTTAKKVVPIDDVLPNPWNPNFMDKGMFEKAKKSVEELGMLGSILVRDYIGRYQIMDGEHRWKVAKELGYTEIPVEVIIGDVTDDMAKLLTIHLNNLHGKDDVFKRAEILRQLNEGQLALLPFSEEEIENEKKFVEFDFAQYDVAADAKPREFGMVVVLPMTTEEGAVWRKAKELLMERGKIDKDNNKKRQDIQVVMYLLENMLNIHLGGVPEERSRPIQL